MKKLLASVIVFSFLAVGVAEVTASPVSVKTELKKEKKSKKKEKVKDGKDCNTTSPCCKSKTS
jgi:hypothetical protein